MRVGVVVGGSSPTVGGEYTFRKSLVDAIKSLSSRHSFVILDEPLELEQCVGDQPRYVERARRAIGLHRWAGPAARQLHRVARAITFGRDELATLEQRIRVADIDLVWFLTPGKPPVSVPYFATVWDLQHRLQPFFPEVSVTGWKWEDRERSYRFSLLRAARIITGTRVGKEEIVRFYGVAPENVRVIPLPSPKLKLRAPSAEQEARINIREKFKIDREFIFYPAQFWPHKNHVSLLMALDLLRRKDLDFDLVLTGADKGNLGHVAETVARLGLKSRVHMLGFVSQDELEALYREAVALVYTSYFGPDNLPPLEAFTLDCPVAAARIAGAEEQLEDAALLFDPADPVAIASAVKTLYSDAKLRERLIKRGRELAASRSPGNYVEQICAILDEFETVRRCWGRRYIHT